MKPYEKLLKVELKRVNDTLILINSLRRTLDTSCPVCRQVHKMKTFVCGCPTQGIESWTCPAVERCKSFVNCTNDLDTDLNKAGWILEELLADLIHQSNCKHKWTADQDNQCNSCTECDIQKDHF